MSDVFDQPSLWRIEASRALGLDRDELIAGMSPGPAFPAALRSVAAALPDDCQVIVDIGAGAGGASEWLRRATDATVLAIEPAEGSRAAAVRAFPDLLVVAGNADAVPVCNAAADAVLISGVISLMPDLTALMREVDRVLKANGRVAIGDLFAVGEHGVTARPNTFRTVEEVTTLLTRHGFTLVSVGLGEAEPDASWAEVAERIDRWIVDECSRRAGYAEWKQDQEHLARHIESGDVIGGCAVAQR